MAGLDWFGVLLRQGALEELWLWVLDQARRFFLIDGFEPVGLTWFELRLLLLLLFDRWE